jgi:NAD(P)-dependent dehydrogenase (short-subunit alcohol dehydrogenase family)
LAQTELITKRLDGKIAVITGGNSGIGLATAHRFVQEGAYVFITGLGQSEIDAAVKQIGKNVIGVQGDVTNLADLDRLYAMVKQQKGRINILFGNAGIVELASLGSITESHFDKTSKGFCSLYKRRFRCFRMGARSF